MAELLDTTAKITSAIEDVINQAKGEKLILITPYLKIARLFKSYITDQENFRTNVKVVVRQGENHNPSDISFLQELKGVELYTLENLHAKCYLNHKTAIITSMNLYEYSQMNNTELGICVQRETDPELYDQINDTANRIVRQSTQFEYEIKKVDKPKVNIHESEKSTKNSQEKKASNTPESGYCIRCGEKIAFNPNRPLCDKCYPIWAKYGDTKYSEKYCHVCGKDDPSHKSCYEKPVCYSCYKKYFK